jgi:hypothetical protein
MGAPIPAMRKLPEPLPPRPANWENRPLAPSFDNLERYPALKEAWEHYLIVKKLIGV